MQIVTGVYIIFDENDEVVYIGSAYTEKFDIRNRLKIHLRGHKSNATIVNHLVNKVGMKREDAIKKIQNYTFIAYECKSLEYELIKGSDKLYNSKGIKR